jgi:hypothetical protein
MSVFKTRAFFTSTCFNFVLLIRFLIFHVYSCINMCSSPNYTQIENFNHTIKYVEHRLESVTLKLRN